MTATAKWRKGDVTIYQQGWAWKLYPKTVPGYLCGCLGIWKNDLDWYCITHQPTGLGITSRKTLREAKRIALELMERFDLTVCDRKASEQWKPGDDETMAAIKAYLNP